MSDDQIRLRSTYLKIGWSRSMLAMRAAIDAPAGESKAMQFGSIAHAWILQGKRPVVFDGARRYGKAWDEFSIEHINDVIATRDEYERAKACDDAIRRHPAAGPMIAGADSPQVEWTIEWDDPECGPCQATIDLYAANIGLADLKTAQSIDRRNFAKQAGSLGYHIQLGWYRRALRAAGIAVDSADDFTSGMPVHIIAVESAPPHDVAVYRMPASYLDYGERAAVMVAKQYRECERTGEFPGAVPGVEEIEIPEWCLTGPAAVPSGEMSASELE